MLFGSPPPHYFALALSIGIWFGIYSSAFVAAALARQMGVKREDLMKVAVMDLSEIYRRIVQKYFPNAQVVAQADCRHVAILNV